MLIKLFYFEHIFSCVWYFVGRYTYENGFKNWLSEAGVED
jgi:hypothetical protein